MSVQFYRALNQYAHKPHCVLQVEVKVKVKVKVVNLYSASRVHASNALGLVTN